MNAPIAAYRFEIWASELMYQLGAGPSDQVMYLMETDELESFASLGLYAVHETTLIEEGSPEHENALSTRQSIRRLKRAELSKKKKFDSLASSQRTAIERIPVQLESVGLPAWMHIRSAELVHAGYQVSYFDELHGGTAEVTYLPGNYAAIKSQVVYVMEEKLGRAFRTPEAALKEERATIRALRSA